MPKRSFSKNSTGFLKKRVKRLISTVFHSMGGSGNGLARKAVPS